MGEVELGNSPEEAEGYRVFLLCILRHHLPLLPPRHDDSQPSPQRSGEGQTAAPIPGCSCSQTWAARTRALCNGHKTQPTRTLPARPGTAGHSQRSQKKSVLAWKKQAPCLRLFSVGCQHAHCPTGGFHPHTRAHGSFGSTARAAGAPARRQPCLHGPTLAPSAPGLLCRDGGSRPPQPAPSALPQRQAPPQPPEGVPWMQEHPRSLCRQGPSLPPFFCRGEDNQETSPGPGDKQPPTKQGEGALQGEGAAPTSPGGSGGPFPQRSERGITLAVPPWQKRSQRGHHCPHTRPAHPAA